MNRSKDHSWKIYSVILLIQAFHSLKAWFMWWLPDFPAAVLFGVVSVLYMGSIPHFWKYNDSRRVGIAIAIMMLFLFRTDGNVFAYLVSFVSAFPLIALVFLKSELQMDVLEKFQKVITVILALSLFFWVWHLVGIDLPSYDTTYGVKERDGVMEAQYYFSNHYFYLVSNTWFITRGIVPDFFRFNSVFIEPGYLSILMVFLLLINKFDLKDRRNMLYIAVIIATVSLAGFLMGVFAYIAHSVQHSRRGITGMAIVAVLLFFSYDFFKEYNHGNNFINQGIIERLEYDSYERKIAGDNRTSIALDNDFERFVTSNNLWFGLGRKADLEFGVGYKAYLMRYGVFGLSLFLIYMLMIARIGGNYKSYMLLTLYILMFIRGDVTMFWHGFMLVYIAGVIQSKYEKFTDEKNSNRITVQRV